MRKTKIICTMGPSTDNDQILREMMLAGMDVARLNFSHQDQAGHLKRFEQVVRLREELGLPIATLLDTKGPEIRLKQFKNGKAELKRGELFTLSVDDDVMGDETLCPITYKGLVNDVEIGSRILIDDGLIEMVVEGKNDGDIICKVINGGVISNNKGINVPDASLSLPYISEKDQDDIIFGIKTGFDFIAASFTRCADDITQVRNILEGNGGGHVKIIAKIENAEGVANIDEILRVADGIMVARGDMGVEIPLEEVPVIQKKLIKKAYNAGKQVITATQMLDSMIKNPRPTRAESTDVANAIYDGTSAIMLSGETAAGLYPVESVKTMARIAIRAERDIDYKKRFLSRADPIGTPNVTDAISHATCTTAYDLGAAAIITVTKSGQTARMISKYRPAYPIISCTTDPHVYRQMNLSWGVRPLMFEEEENSDALFEGALHAAQRANFVKSGDLVIMTGGVPIGVSGTTNLLRVSIVGDVLVSGRGVNKTSAFGNLCVCRNEEEALRNFKQNDILVIGQTSNRILPLIKHASGIITEEDGVNSHAAIVGLTLDIPVIVGAANATKILKSGTIVTMDADSGNVSNGLPQSQKSE